MLVLVGAVAAAINAVAGGGSLLSFPALTVGYAIPSVLANATNSVSLWPGSLSGGVGYWNLIKKTGHYFKVFLAPTVLGSLTGAFLLVQTSHRSFDLIVPWLILFAALILVLQPRIKSFAESSGHALSPKAGLIVQFLVAVYGGYFGAGMGIMMLGAFALTMEGDIHELNAVKNWLSLIINLVCSLYFIYKGLVVFPVAAALTVGSLFGGYAGAKLSQRVPSEKLRLAIAIYGIGMAALFFYRSLS